MLQKKVQLTIITVIAIILLSNLFPLRLFIEGVIIPYPYETENSEFEYVACPSKGLSIEFMENKFLKFLEENPQTKDTIIYRKFKRNPLKFWNWKFYLTSNLYDYPLKK
ncbi:hypothetical protein [Mesonia sp. K7]|uniref:hypothetical protein n=1 Tax=Mesonia sp. K7 TaxID=2218606 RepID=UPI000DA8281B|nr:hypothetical protein [Mesonia sp. K7]PZD77415.1 hypothetical protein DNG35_08850 [Mesonia sp. K7]